MLKQGRGVSIRRDIMMGTSTNTATWGREWKGDNGNGVIKTYMSLPCFVEWKGHISLLLLGNKVKDDQSPTFLTSKGGNRS